MSVVLNCQEASALHTEHAEGALTGAAKASFVFHMTICDFCRRYRKQLEQTVSLLRALPDDAPVENDVDEVLRLLKG